MASPRGLWYKGAHEQLDDNHVGSDNVLPCDCRPGVLREELVSRPVLCRGDNDLARRDGDVEGMMDARTVVGADSRQEFLL